MIQVCMFPECAAVIGEVPDCEDGGEHQVSHGICRDCAEKLYPDAERAICEACGEVDSALTCECGCGLTLCVSCLSVAHALRRIA